jgi:hypothetical protein
MRNKKNLKKFFEDTIRCIHLEIYRGRVTLIFNMSTDLDQPNSEVSIVTTELCGTATIPFADILKDQFSDLAYYSPENLKEMIDTARAFEMYARALRNEAKRRGAPL